MSAKRQNAARVFESTHWGVPATKKWVADEPDLPRDLALVQMGVLRELRCQAGSNRFDLHFPTSCHLAFDPGASRRLYLLLTQPVRRQMKRDLWLPSEPTYPLAEVARSVGGRQAKYWHPDVIVQVVGQLNAVVYQTKKRGDDAELGSGGQVVGPGSEYIHRLSEDSHGPKPRVCLAPDGRLWLAAGSYSIVRDGIVD